MGMLLHNTWLKQQEALKAKAKEAEAAVEEEIPFNDHPEVPEEPKKESKPKAPAKKPAARRKTSK